MYDSSGPIREQRALRESDFEVDLYMKTHNILLSIGDYIIALEEMKGKPES